MEQAPSGRSFGPDAVRFTASALVIAVHFFLNTDFYTLPLRGEVMACASLLRMLCMTCVPMFLMLSGYLCLDRKWERGYLRGLLPVALTWIVASVFCLLFRRFGLKESFGFGYALLRILDFTAVPYGWYVEMYAGLYLLMPLLNAAWNGQNATGKRATLGVLCALTVLPSLVNAKWTVLPDWWSGIYPLFYYFLGAALRERPLSCRGGLLLCGWIGAAAAAAALRLVAAGGGCFTWTTYIDWASPFVAAESVCLFSLLLRAGGSCAFGGIVSRLSRLSLPIYLSSYIGDSLVYPLLNRFAATYLHKLLFYIPAVLASYLLAAALALVTALCVKGAAALLTKKNQTEKS